MTVPRPAHQPVWTEHDRVPIAIFASMGDAEDAQETLEWRPRWLIERSIGILTRRAILKFGTKRRARWRRSFATSPTRGFASTKPAKSIRTPRARLPRWLHPAGSCRAAFHRAAAPRPRAPPKHGGVPPWHRAPRSGIFAAPVAAPPGHPAAVRERGAARPADSFARASTCAGRGAPSAKDRAPGTVACPGLRY